MDKTAAISACGQYRYRLTRSWDQERGILPIVMLNPSTADAEVDDPTIGRCISFARRDGFGGILVVNLFAFRAPAPDDMMAAADPVGPDNDVVLTSIFGTAAQLGIPVLAAWGANGEYNNRADQVGRLALQLGARLVCLGRTAAGHPRHPLYVRSDQAFEGYE